MLTGILEKVSQYLYSSSSNYSVGKGLIDIEIAINPVIDVLAKNEF
ncbi:hypothetical protein [Kaistella sp.]